MLARAVAAALLTGACSPHPRAQTKPASEAATPAPIDAPDERATQAEPAPAAAPATRSCAGDDGCAGDEACVDGRCRRCGAPGACIEGHDCKDVRSCAPRCAGAALCGGDAAACPGDERCAWGCCVPLPVVDCQLKRTGELLFKIDKWDVDPRSFPTLDALARTLEILERAHVFIDVHIAYEGPPRGARLAQRRAEKLAEHLVMRGIDRARLTPRGFSEGRAVDDRVDFLIRDCEALDRAPE